MRYQLVLQFPENIMDYKTIGKIESLNMTHENKSELDGHDIESAKINFFIRTNNIEKTFKQIINLLNDKYKKTIKASYREITGENYIILWPKNLKEFYVA